MNNTKILLTHNCVSIPNQNNVAGKEAIATIIVNLAYYGRGLSEEGYNALCKLDSNTLVSWWQDVEKQLKEITGASKNMDKFVVYKNFPEEVLNKSEAEYWIPQILMYLGFDKKFFVEEEKPRSKMSEAKKPIILRLVDERDGLQFIMNSHLANPSAWKKTEKEEVLFLFKICDVDFSKIVFKENLIALALNCIKNNIKVVMKTATDVLRFGAGLSNGDFTLKTNTKFKSLNRASRKYLLNLIENCNNIEEDFARRKEMFKRFLKSLHPGDFKQFPKTIAAMNNLYNDKISTFASKVEILFKNKDLKVLDLLSTRPGDFKRRLVQCMELFGNSAVESFTNKKVLSKLSVYQLASTKSYLSTINSRKTRCVPPKGNWKKIKDIGVKKVNSDLIVKVYLAVSDEIKSRVPAIKVLDKDVNMVKLPSKGELSVYTKGTRFKIPDNVKFIRTASYWKGSGTIWFDNGWNFFDDNFKDAGSCSWTVVNTKGAIFSGDPVNSKEMEGRAAQMIDLYPNELINSGVRYAVWSVLCYSHIPFSKAEEVYAALQWGENEVKGKLFEPSRCQLSFALTGNDKSKFVCLIDLQEREMLYLDVSLPVEVSTASRNNAILSDKLPGYIDYLNSLPSIYDVFESSVSNNSDIKVLYSDKNHKLDGQKAYVFKQENKLNKFEQLNINDLLK